MTKAIVPFEIANTPLSKLGLANIGHNKRTGRDPDARGMFADTPVSTPKFSTFRPNRKGEYEDTMARMLLQVPRGTLESLINELEDDDTKEIARILANDGATGGFGYLDFFLQTATHTFAEKVQISETLSDNYVAFFYGSSPPIFQYTGMLMNTYEDDWNMRMYRIFRDLGRGTQLARRGSLFHLRYDSTLVSGAMLNFSSVLTAGQENAVNFSFNFLVKKLEIILGSYTAHPTDLRDVTVSSQDVNGVVDMTTATFAALPTTLVSPSGQIKVLAETSPTASSPAGVSQYSRVELPSE